MVQAICKHFLRFGVYNHCIDERILLAMKKLLPIFVAVFVLLGCGTQNSSNINHSTQTVEDSPVQASAIPLPDIDDDVVVQAGNEELQNGNAVITLNGDSISIDGEGANSEGSVVTITAAGTYLVSGTLTDGQLRVDTESSDKVTVILNGVDITCSDGPAIYILNAQKKVVLKLADESVNVVKDGEVYSDTSEDAPSSAIFSKEDLDIDGNGTLYVTGNYNKGIFSKDDLSIEGGTIIVSAVDDGMRGKDSVEISGGSITITCGADGLRTNNETDADKGYINISGGEIYITAGQDGIQAVSDCVISGGTLSISSGGGSQNSSTQNDSWGSWGGGHGGGKGGMGSMGSPSQGGGNNTSSTDATSAKGIKAAGTLSILGATISIDSSDDALHSNDSINITGGEIYVSSGDDGIHADSALTIDGGVVTVEKSYEGLEALNITINGGSISVVASDDGINAAGGNDGSSMNGRPGQNSFASDSSGLVSINGGEIVLNASGDGLDSNGNIVQTDGSVVVFGPTNSGNGPLDYAGTYTLSGGSLLSMGAVGMAQTINDCQQGQLAFTLRATADSTIEIQDTDGNVILSCTTPKSMECFVCSTPNIIAGQSYSVFLNGEALGELEAQ